MGRDCDGFGLLGNRGQLICTHLTFWAWQSVVDGSTGGLLMGALDNVN